MQTLIIKTAAGELPVDLFSNPTRRPLVVLLMDAIGIREELRDLARDIAAQGFDVALPNLYYREGHIENLDLQSPAGRDRIMSLYASLSHAMVIDDMNCLLTALAEGRAVGVLGFCMGGANALVTAGSFPEIVRAAAAIHPGGIVTDAVDSPHRIAPAARGALYIAIADQDPFATAEQAAELGSALASAGVDFQLEIYEGAQHGFAFASLPSYNEKAQRRYWRAVCSLFQRHLT